jgi:hypothetical protein
MLNIQEQWLEIRDDGYWGVVFGRLMEMLRDLDWECLGKMATGARWEYLRVEAEQRCLAAAQATWG